MRKSRSVISGVLLLNLHGCEKLLLCRAVYLARPLCSAEISLICRYSSPYCSLLDKIFGWDEEMFFRFISFSNFLHFVLVSYLFLSLDFEFIWNLCRSVCMCKVCSKNVSFTSFSISDCLIIIYWIINSFFSDMKYDLWQILDW